MSMEELLKGCKGSQIKISQVRDWLLDNIRDNMDRQVRITLNIWSTPGVGKTSLVKELSRTPVEWRGKKYDGFEIIDIPLAQIEEMGDVLGYPVEEIRMEKGKESRWIKAVNALIEDFLKKGWTTQGEQRTIYAPPSWAPREERPGILLFDDGNRASQRIMKGLMQLVQDYRTISWEIPQGWTIVFTGNPDNRNNQVTAMDMAQLTRMKHVTLLPDVEEWAKWALLQPDIDDRLVQWARTSRESFIPAGAERTNPRSLAEFGRALRRFPDLSKPRAFEACAIEGEASLDKIVVDEIMAFLQQHIEEPIDPDMILTNADEARKRLRNLMRRDEPGLPVLYVSFGRLTKRLMSDEYKYDESHNANLQAWLGDENMPKDLAYTFATQLMQSKEELAMALLGDMLESLAAVGNVTLG